MTLEEIFDICDKQWIRANNDKKHPFRYFTLATINKKGRAKARMVVLRNYDSKTKEFTIYTDARSQKVSDLKQQPKAQLIFYNPKKRLQILVDVHLITMDSPQELFNNQPARAQKDYTSILPPRTPMENPEGIVYEKDKNFFTRLILKAEEIEILQLNSIQHYRARFKSTPKGWKNTFLIP